MLKAQLEEETKAKEELQLQLSRIKNQQIKKSKFKNDTLRAAVNEWYDDSAAAELKYGNIRDWDTSDVTSMTELFLNKRNFNGDLSLWNVSNVTTMRSMFSWASTFNGDLSSWDVSNVITMVKMFHQASAFNCDLSSWDVSNVSYMRWMFSGVSSFNEETIKNWDLEGIYKKGLFERYVIKKRKKPQATKIINRTTCGTWVL